MIQKFKLLLILLCCAALMSGCQAFKSKLSALQKLPSPKDLAFWKKESDAMPPSPPSRHLNPSIVSSDTESGIAGMGTGEAGSSAQRDIRNSLDAAAPKMASQFGSNTKQRSPYTVDDDSSVALSGAGDVRPSGSSSKNNSSFGGGSSSKNLAQSGQSSLSAAQQKFRSAIGNMEPMSKGSNQGSTTKNSGMFSSLNSSAGSSSKGMSPSSGEAGSAFKSLASKSGFSESLSKVGQSIQDVNDSVSAGQKSFASAAENKIDAARERFSQAIGAVGDGARNVAKSSSEFAGDMKDRFASTANELKSSLTGGSAFKSIPDSGSNVGGGGQTRVAEVIPFRPSTQGSSTKPGTSQNLASNSMSGASGFKPLDRGNVVQTEPKGRLKNPFYQQGSSSRNAQGIPSSYQRGTNATVGHVSDVDVPAKILQGSGSYAPGSVNIVR